MKLTINGVRYHWYHVHSQNGQLERADFICYHGIPKSITRAAAGSDFGETVKVRFEDFGIISNSDMYVVITGKNRFCVQRGRQ